MTRLNRFAAALMLTTGFTGTVFVQPALAQKNKKGDEKPGLKLSPEALKAAQIAQPALAAKDYATAEPAIAQIEAAAKTDDDRYVAAALRYELESQKLYSQQQANPKAPIDETVLAQPLDVLINAPSTPAADRGKYAFRRGSLAYNSKDYASALRYFAQAQQFGYNDPNLPLMMVKAKYDTGDVAGGSAAMHEAIAKMKAAGQKVPEDYYRYAIAKSNTAKMSAETMKWLQDYISAYPTPKNWRDVLVTYALQPNSVVTLDNTQKIDVFRLMRATNSLADQTDYLDYGQKVIDRGLPAEAQAVVKEGLASGKIPASNSTAKDMLSVTSKSLSTDTPLGQLETRANASSSGKLAASTGDAYLAEANYAKAATLYRTALQKGGVDQNEVNTHLGIALGRSGDKAAANAAFGAVNGEPRSGIASFWTTWLGSQG